MRSQWIVLILYLLVAMGLLVVILGQRQAIAIIESGSEKLGERLKTLDEEAINREMFEMAVDNLVVQGSKALEALEATVAKLDTDRDKRKTENEACQAEKKRKTDELVSSEKELAQTQASLKSESDAWNQEIVTLKAQLMGHRPICDHLKPGTLALKLCGINASSSASPTSTA